jgi:CRISPR/Cas system CMR-associated protein Cmr5 small subunit
MINKKQIDTLIPHAFKSINDTLADSDRKIDSVYASYIAAYGPTVRYAGLLQTVLFYAGDNKKKKINHILWSILKEANTPGLEGGSLQGYVQANANSRIAKERILEAVVAAKLAIRTFPSKEGEKHAKNQKD